MLKPIALLVLCCGLPVLAQDTPRRLTLTNESNIPAIDITKVLRMRCPNVGITDDMSKSDFALEAIKNKGSFSRATTFSLTLLDHNGITFRSLSLASIDDDVKQLCKALNTEVLIEVVDANNLTLSSDVRRTDVGLPSGIAESVAGRQTHTDAATMFVVVNGEHALLDCFEHRKGCIPVGPGKYYAELAADKKSLWVDHEVPISHIRVRDHYVIAGSW